MISLFVVWAVLLYAPVDFLPVVPMHMNPEQLANSLRYAKPTMDQRDCRALNLWECKAGDAVPVKDVLLRFVQLDDDPELEAIIVTEAKAEWTYMAYVFDRRGTVWNMVGMFSCNRRPCDVAFLARVEKLTADSPPLFLYYRDVGGSGSMIMLTTAFLLRQGRLLEIRDFVSCSENLFPVDTKERQLVSTADRHLIIYTIQQQESDPENHICEVLRWDHQYLRFYKASNEPTRYCDPKVGRPVAGRSHPTGIRTCPAR